MDRGYTFFWGHQRSRIGDKAVFSQWYPSDFYSDGNKFPTAEHWMMYQKACLFGDFVVADQILRNPHPKAAKDFGRSVKGFDEETWEAERVGIVRLGNILKFSQSEELECILRDTGKTILVEASPYDCIWGIGMKETSRGAQDPAEWRGLNLLGYVLMDVRDILGGGTKTKIGDWT